MISNIVVKLLGLLCKIPLHDLLQDQGMGYFNIAYNIFTTLYMVSTAGLPTAVTIMISDTPAGSSRRRQVERIFRVALAVFFAWHHRNLHYAVFCKAVGCADGQ